MRRFTRTTVVLATAIGMLPALAATAPAQPASEFKVFRGHLGFWSIGQDASKVWWFVSPAGRAEFLNMVTTVQPYQRGRDGNGPSFVSSNWDGGSSTTGDLDLWAKETLTRVYDTGFKGLGARHDWCMMQGKAPIENTHAGRATA